METAVRKRHFRKKRNYSFWDCMKLQQMFVQDDILRGDYTIGFLMAGVMIFFALSTRNLMVVCGSWSYIVLELWMFRSIVSSKQNLSKVVPVPKRTLIKIRFVHGIAELMVFFAVCFVGVFVYHLALYGFDGIPAIFTECGYVYIEMIYTFLCAMFLCMLLMPVAFLQNKKKAVMCEILTLLSYGLLTLILLHWSKEGEGVISIFPITFLNLTNEIGRIANFPVRLIGWICISCALAVASFFVCCRLNQGAEMQDSAGKEKTQKKDKENSPRSWLPGVANMNLKPGASFFIMLVCAGLLVVAAAGQHDIWQVFLIMMLLLFLIGIGLIAVAFKNRKNIIHRLPVDTNGLIKMSLKYVGIISIFMILCAVLGCMAGVVIALNDTEESARMFGISPAGIAGILSLLFCIFWLTVPYLFAGEKKWHTRVSTNFVLGSMIVIVLLYLPYWNNGGREIVMKLPVFLALPVLLMVQEWWSYLTQEGIMKVPAALQKGVEFLLNIVCWTVGIWMWGNGQEFYDFIFASGSAAAKDLLTLSSAGGTSAWMMAGIGLLCAIAVVPFSLGQMRWLIAPDRKKGAA